MYTDERRFHVSGTLALPDGICKTESDDPRLWGRTRRDD
jgi:hypothetical protein